MKTDQVIRVNIIMIHKKNNNQGVFLELLVAAKNIIQYFTSLKHKIFSLIFSKFDGGYTYGGYLWYGVFMDLWGVYLGRGNWRECEGIRNQRRPYCSGIDHTLLFFSNSLSSEVKPRLLWWVNGWVTAWKH